jgi:hypothetical protein
MPASQCRGVRIGSGAVPTVALRLLPYDDARLGWAFLWRQARKLLASPGDLLCVAVDNGQHLIARLDHDQGALVWSLGVAKFPGACFTLFDCPPTQLGERPPQLRDRQIKCDANVADFAPAKSVQDEL